MNPRTKKSIIMHKALPLRDRLYMSRKEGWRVLASIEDYVDEYAKQSEESLIALVSNNGNGSVNRKTRKMGRRIWILRVPNSKDCTRDYLEMAKKGKPLEKN